MKLRKSQTLTREINKKGGIYRPLAATKTLNSQAASRVLRACVCVCVIGCSFVDTWQKEAIGLGWVWGC